MDPQIVDLGGSVLVLGILWPVIARSIKGLNRRLDKVEKGQAELRTGQAELAKDVAGLKAGQAELRADMKSDVAGLAAGQARMEDHIIQLAGGLGEVKGELKRIVPREKVTAGGS